VSWFGRGKKRARQAAEVEAARARVEQAQRALVPFAGALSAPLRARLQAAERAWRDALPGEDDDEAALGRALEVHAGVSAELDAVLRAAARAHPELASRTLLAAAAEQLSEVEAGARRCGAALRLAAAAIELDAALAVRACTRALEIVEAEGEPQHLFTLARLVFHAADVHGDAAPVALRERAVARLHAGPLDDPEWASWRFGLMDAQATFGDLDGARATLATLDGEYREQALHTLLEAELRRGDEDAARECLAAMRSRTLRTDGEVALVVAQARGGRWPEALAAAHALADGRARALAKLAGLRALAGEHDAAAALLREIEPEEQDEGHLELLEAELERGDLAAAEERIEELAGDEARGLAWRRIADETAEAADSADALARLERVPEPFLQAAALERLGWRRLARGDADGAQEHFARALEIAAVVARAQGRSARAPGGVHHVWILLAGRLQAALGDCTSALACLGGTADLDLRIEGLFELGRAFGAAGDLASVMELQAALAQPFERSLVAEGALEGLATLRRLQAPAGG
jgi:hypothetical protein